MAGGSAAHRDRVGGSAEQAEEDIDRPEEDSGNEQDYDDFEERGGEHASG